MSIGVQILLERSSVLTAYEIISIMFSFTMVVIEVIRLVIDILRKK